MFGDGVGTRCREDVVGTQRNQQACTYENHEKDEDRVQAAKWPWPTRGVQEHAEPW